MNRVVHFEIPSNKTTEAREFYSSVFGWKFDTFHGEESGYWLCSTGEGQGIDGALMKKQDPAQPVTIIIQVEDIDAAMKSVEEAGGEIVLAKHKVGEIGYSGYFKDPDDNILGVWQSLMAQQ
ncbi:MAG TPA: VOC family protein [Fimbriimonadaceae bacterium]|nr:VOC family protein [Fimbriimonadaceae bacterium]